MRSTSTDMSRFRLRPDKCLRFVLGLYLALAFLYSLSIPLWEAPDEPSHYLCIRRFSDGPRFSPPRAGRPATSVWSEAYLYSLYQKMQPPLYYLLATPLTALVSARLLPLGEPPPLLPVRKDFQREGNLFIHQRPAWGTGPPENARLLLIRFFSILFGAGTVWLIFTLARLVFPDRPEAAVAAAGFAAALPQFSFITAVVSNDAVASLMGTAGLLLIVRRGGQRSPSGKDALILGALLALGLLAKLNLIFLFPTALLAVGLSVQGRGRGKKFIRDAALILLPSFCLLLLLTVGFPRELSLQAQMFFRRLIGTNPQLLPSDRIRLMLTEIFQSFFARFGWMSVKVGGWMYLAWGGVCLVGAAGWIRKSIGGPAEPAPTRKGLGILLAGFLLLLLGVLKNNLIVTQAQGRFLFPALAAPAVFVSVGILNLFPARWGRGVAVALVFAFAALNLVALFGYLIPAGYPSP